MLLSSDAVDRFSQTAETITPQPTAVYDIRKSARQKDQNSFGLFVQGAPQKVISCVIRGNNIIIGISTMFFVTKYEEIEYYLLASSRKSTDLSSQKPPITPYITPVNTFEHKKNMLPTIFLSSGSVGSGSPLIFQNTETANSPIAAAIAILATKTRGSLLMNIKFLQSNKPKDFQNEAYDQLSYRGTNSTNELSCISFKTFGAKNFLQPRFSFVIKSSSA